MTFSKLLAALASTLLLNPLAQVHGDKEFIMPPYDISTSSQGDVIEITLKSFLASDEESLETRFQCQNGSSDEHYVGTTVSKQQTMNILIRNDAIVVGSIVDEVDGNVYQFSKNESGDLQGTVRHTSDFPDEIDPVEDDVNIPSRHLRDIYSSRHTSDFPEGIDPVEDDVNIPSRHLRDIYSSNERNLQTNCPKHVVHVLVPWTWEAECMESGQNPGCDRTESTARKITDLIELAIAETNFAYETSGVKVNGQPAELKLAHAYYESTITESLGFSGILYQTKGSSVIAAQRTKYGADVVASIISLSQFCGIAYIGPNIYNMFSVTGRTCATGYFSFGHEIGHNMGALHDRGTQGDCSSTAYSFGYRDPQASFRSILAYSCMSGQCDNNDGGGCTRVQRFSNDEFLYNGKAIGNSRADNARQHSDVFAAVSAYYECKDSSTDTPTTSGQTKTPTAQPLPTSSPIFTTDVPTIFKTCADTKILANEREGRSGKSSAGLSFIFKLEAISDIIIDTIFLEFAETATTVSLWTKTGSYEGYERDETKWTNIVNGVAMGTGDINKEYFTPVKIDKGTDQSFYLYVFGTSIYYKAGRNKGDVDAENNDLKMIWGVNASSKWNEVRSWKEQMVHTKINYKVCKSEEPPSQNPTKLCVDDQSFTKSRGGRKRTCEYIGKGNKQWRLNKWCNKNKNGSPISEACCETCKKCNCGAGCGKAQC